MNWVWKYKYMLNVKKNIKKYNDLHKKGVQKNFMCYYIKQKDDISLLM